MTQPFLTVGHSTRTLAEFLALLDSADVRLVVDVRRLPGSRRHPHFDEEALRESLPGAGIDYRRLPALAGRRSRDRDVPDEGNGFWQNRSFHNYADHALSAEFRDGLAELRSWGAERRLAVMCSEAVWWRCHRRLVADRLTVAGDPVLHISSQSRADTHELPPSAVVADHGQITYPPDAPTLWP